MKKRFYLVTMVDGIDPDCFGGWDTEAEQEQALIKTVKENQELGPDGQSSICWLEVDEGGMPHMGSYSAWYMNQVRQTAGYDVGEEDDSE